MVHEHMATEGGNNITSKYSNKKSQEELAMPRLYQYGDAGGL
jgi:hypothetical protein